MEEQPLLHTFTDNTIDQIVLYAGIEIDGSKVYFEYAGCVRMLTRWGGVSRHFRQMISSDDFVDNYKKLWGLDLRHLRAIAAVLFDMQDSYSYRVDSPDRSLIALPIIHLSEKMMRVLDVPNLNNQLESNENIMRISSKLFHRDLYCLYFKLDGDYDWQTKSYDMKWKLKLDKNVGGTGISFEMKDGLNAIVVAALMADFIGQKCPFVIIDEKNNEYNECELYPDIYGKNPKYWHEDKTCEDNSYESYETYENDDSYGPDDIPESLSRVRTAEMTVSFISRLIWHMIQEDDVVSQYNPLLNAIRIPVIGSHEILFEYFCIERSVTKALGIMNERNNYKKDLVYELSISYVASSKDFNCEVLVGGDYSSFEGVPLKYEDVEYAMRMVDQSRINYYYVDLKGKNISSHSIESIL